MKATIEGFCGQTATITESIRLHDPQVNMLLCETSRLAVFVEAGRTERRGLATTARALICARCYHAPGVTPAASAAAPAVTPC